MASPKKPDDCYYYAGGERITLTPAQDLLAFDQAAASKGALDKVVAGLSARPLTSGVSLVEQDQISAKDRQALSQAGALRPVFRAADAILVVLPEIRVEDSRPGQVEQLQDWFSKHCDDVEVESPRAGRFTVRPKSGSGEDALALSNALVEELGAQVSQVRFVRVVPRPGTAKP
ncbi:MAG: hypothetical protein L0211_16925 [Planctomycetaceae bacterium]|nr:hypothetical protein [Planctomycetaceae bacterium]